MHICTVITDTAQSLQTERNKNVFKQDLDYDSDGVHLTSFGIDFQTEEEAKENKRSPCVALLCAGLLRRAWCMSWIECCGCAMTLYAACQRHMMVQYCCGCGSTNKLFCKCFLL